MNEMSCYVVRYTGPFGFIKPWTAVRDETTYSQQFLTPSIVEGMRQKLGVSAILRHRLSHSGFSLQQEQVQAPAFKFNSRIGVATRSTSIIRRGVLLDPVLHLALPTIEDGESASTQHICLCRNEDVLLPWRPNAPPVLEMLLKDFEEITGFELLFGPGADAFLVGYNRYEHGAPMYGRLVVCGDPSIPPAVEL